MKFAIAYALACSLLCVTTASRADGGARVSSGRVDIERATASLQRASTRSTGAPLFHLSNWSEKYRCPVEASL
ncbi:hypothetical protein [Alloalcanivorax marinus]|uniref:hypothetical protein n=1 Tax=Alloalcanivorax marinus TaxID=1177169 RepID=UPI0019319873|nr:hypothetical protein [Alloalcanivorax marinus]MBL7251869.1 hypothetical protein [Alloalcanivorax marinus]